MLIDQGGVSPDDRSPEGGEKLHHPVSYDSPVYRLYKEVDHTCLSGSTAIGLVIMRGNHDDLSVRAVAQAAHALYHLVPTEIRHVCVDHHHIGRMSDKLHQRVFTSNGKVKLREVKQGSSEDVNHAGIVINDQDRTPGLDVISVGSSSIAR